MPQSNLWEFASFSRKFLQKLAFLLIFLLMPKAYFVQKFLVHYGTKLAHITWGFGLGKSFLYESVNSEFQFSGKVRLTLTLISRKPRKSFLDSTYFSR